MPQALTHRIALICALLLGASGTLVRAQSEVEAASYAINGVNAAAPEAPWVLKISGIWPSACPPTLERVTRAGNELRIDARAVLSLCARRQTAFSIEVNPALALHQDTLAAGQYQVGFYAANGNAGTPKLRAFALLDHASESPEVSPESGFWWSAGDLQSGTHRLALSLELQGRQLSAALLTYAADGSTVWQFGTATIQGRIAHVPLLHMRGGSDPFAAIAAAPHGEPGLTLDLQFHSGASASAWLSRRSADSDEAVLELTPFDLIRLPSAEAVDASTWRGDWVLTADSDSAPAQRLRFSQTRTIDEHSFELVDENSAVFLRCERGDQRLGELPRSCALRMAAGTPLGRFDALAISRMDGTRADGVALHLLRISR